MWWGGRRPGLRGQLCLLKWITWNNSCCSPCIFLSDIPFFQPHPPPATPLTIPNCPSSHLYLITAESAAVTHSHTTCSFALHTAKLIYTQSRTKILVWAHTVLNVNPKVRPGQQRKSNHTLHQYCKVNTCRASLPPPSTVKIFTISTFQTFFSASLYFSPRFFHLPQAKRGKPSNLHTHILRPSFFSLYDK